MRICMYTSVGNHLISFPYNFITYLPVMYQSDEVMLLDSGPSLSSAFSCSSSSICMYVSQAFA